MKKLGGKIALILVLVMLANSFTGCLTYAAIEGGGDMGALVLFTLPIDIITLPFQLIGFIVIKANEAARDKRGNKYDNIDSFSKAIKTLPEEELGSLVQTVDSLPKEELAALTQRFYSLPEAELAPFTEAVNSFSETEISAMMAAFNRLSEAEIAASIETFNSMPDESLIAALNNVRHNEFRYQY